MAEIDNLTIQISAEARAADTALNNLVSKLNTLSSSLGKLNGEGLKSFSSAMQMFTSSMQGIKDINASQFTKVAKGIQKFESIDSGKIASVSNAMKPLAQSINTLNGLTFDGANINSFVNSLAKLSQTNAGSLNSVNFGAIGNSIKQMTNALSGASDVSRNTIAITNAIAKLGATGGTIGQVTTSLPALGTALRTFITTMSSAGTVSGETITFTAAIGQLASAGARAATTAANLSTLATELKKFFQTMSSAPTVNSNIIKMTQALANLASQGSKAGSASKSIVSGFNSFSVGAKKASKSATSLAAAFGKFYATWWLVIRLFKKIGEAIDISSDLTEVQNVVDVTFGQYKSKMEDFAGTVSMTEFGISELTAKTIGSRFQAMANAIGITNDAAAEASNFTSKMTNGYTEANGTVADMSVNLTKLAADMASLYNMEADEVAESLQSIYTGTSKPLRQYGLDLTEATLKEWALKNGLDSDISSMTQAEKVLLRYQYVLANTTDAQGDFARTADTWANRVKVLGQQFQALAAIVGEVFINVLKPALRALNSFMSSVINIARTIADALGAIFGWTIDTSDTASVLDDTYDSAEDVSSGLDDATDSAKELSKQLQGFDELNVITTNNDSDSGGSGSGGSSSGTSSAASTSIKETESVLDNYKSSIKDLEGLGEYIGTSLTNAMNSIDWDSIYSKASNFGAGLASFLNGLISPELFSAVGSTIASSLNTALSFLNGFGTTFEWSDFGDSLGAGLNAFLGTFSWGTALTNAVVYGQGIATTLNQFIETTDFGLIGNTVANAVNTAITFALSLGQTFEFTEFGSNLASALTTFFAEFDFGGLAETLNAWVEGIWNAITTAISETDWSTVYDGIKEFLKNLDIETVAILIGAFNLMWGAGVLKSIASSATSKIVASISDSLIAKLPTLWTSIGSGLSAAFSNAGATLVTGFKALLGNGAAESALAFMNPLVTTITGITGVLAGVALAATSFFSMWNEGFSLAKEAVLLLGIALAAIGTVILGVSAAVVAPVAVIVAVVTTAVILIKEHWEGISEFFSGLWDGIKSTASDLWDAVTGFFSTAWEVIKAVWETVSGWFYDYVITPLVDFFYPIIEKIGGFFSSLWNGIKAVWELVSGWFKDNVIDPVRDAWDTATEKIGKFFETLWKGIKSGVVGAMNAVIGGIEGGINFIIRGINSIISGFNKVVSWAAKVADVDWGGVSLLSEVSLTRIKAFEYGGFPDRASLFLAGENGVPEILGTVGGRTAVAGGAEITGIADAVYNTGQTEASLLQTAISLLDIIAAKEFGISKGDLYKSVRQSDREYARRTGASGFVF